DQPPSRPVPVRHRRSRAHRAGEVPEGLRHVCPAVRAPDTGGEREGAQGQLRAALRPGAPACARVGSRSPEMKKEEIVREKRGVPGSGPVRWLLAVSLLVTPAVA